jgi:hypothetical protein
MCLCDGSACVLITSSACTSRFLSEFLSDKRYFDYLQKVKEENETEFPEIEYIINRYSVLSGEQTNLLQKQASLSIESEHLRQAYQQFAKEQGNANLSLNNEIAGTHTC